MAMKYLCSLLALSISASSAIGQEGEDFLLDFIDNAERVQRQYDVTYIELSSLKWPEDRKKEQEDHVTVVRQTAAGEKRRIDVIVTSLGLTSGSTEIMEVHSEMKVGSKIFLVGESGEVTHSQLDLAYHSDPVSKLMLTLDSQANGKGGTQEACMDLFNSCGYVETREVNGKTTSVWIGKNRKMLLEVGFEKTHPMPYSFRYLFVKDGVLSDGDEFAGKYDSKVRSVSESKISWKKEGELFLPTKALMSRGFEGAVQIKIEYDFVEWKIGDQIDMKRLDEAAFVTEKNYRDTIIQFRNKLVGQYLE
jgi:hypothetical protein